MQNYACENDQIKSFVELTKYVDEKLMRDGSKIVDDRKQIFDTSNYPYNCIGCLRTDRGGNNFLFGTAFLIKADLILTVAHNIYLESQSRFASIQKITFCLGENKIEEKKRYNIKGFRVCSQYENDKNGHNNYFYDYALLKLTEEIKTTNKRFVQLGVNWSKFEEIEIYGYPAEKQRNKGRLSPYEGKGLVIPNCENKYMFYHWVNTTGGQSGSPIMIDHKGDIKVIGIHKGGISIINKNNRQVNYNIALIITDQVMQDIFQWDVQMNQDKIKAILYQTSTDVQIQWPHQENIQKDRSFYSFHNLVTQLRNSSRVYERPTINSRLQLQNQQIHVPEFKKSLNTFNKQTQNIIKKGNIFQLSEKSKGIILSDQNIAKVEPISMKIKFKKQKESDYINIIKFGITSKTSTQTHEKNQIQEIFYSSGDLIHDEDFIKGSHFESRTIKQKWVENEILTLLVDHTSHKVCWLIENKVCEAVQFKFTSPHLYFFVELSNGKCKVQYVP